MDHCRDMTPTMPECFQPEWKPLPESCSGIVFLSLTHQILYISPQGTQMLHHVFSLDGEPAASASLPRSLRQLCHDLDHAREQYTGPTEWAAIQIQRTLGPALAPITMRGFVIPEWHAPQMSRLLILLESHQTAVLTDLTLSMESFSLTERQHAVAKGLIRGLTNKELANELHLSAHTVKEYVRVIMVKVRATTRAGAVARLTGAYPGDRLQSTGSAKGPRSAVSNR